jgi:methionine synthase II (cobalamin-independent)
MRKQKEKWRRKWIAAEETRAEVETAVALLFTDEMKAGLDGCIHTE